MQERLTTLQQGLIVLVLAGRCLGTLVCDDSCLSPLHDSRFAEIYDISNGTPRLVDVIDWTPIG